MSDNKNANVPCPICSAENARDAASCSQCGRSLVGAEAAAAQKPAVVVAPPANRATFRLNSLMLVIAGIAIFLGVWHQAPGLAFWLVLPAGIALFRTVAASGHRESGFHHLAVFLVTFVSVFGIALLGFAAFFATCMVIAPPHYGPNGFKEGDNVAVALGISGAVGLAVIIGLTVVFVRASRRARDRRG